MRNATVFLTILASLVIVVSCSKYEPSITTKQEPGKTQRNARLGPGYKWEYSTNNQEDPSEYYYTDRGDRIYYLRGSTNYTRSVTLTVTKTTSMTSDPSFRVYAPNASCLNISPPSVSSGSVEPTSFYQNGFGELYSGYFWSVPLGSSPVGTIATCTFNINIPISSCVEGFIKADMTSPGQINSVSSYWDLDYLYVVKNSGI